MNVDIMDSMDTVEFDTERGLFQATYDSTRDSTCLAVVAVVASALDRDPRALTPLHSVIETDALENLTAELSSGLRNGVSISFCYEDFEVTVFGEGVIEADPLANA